jgi:hypothetical protein
VTEPRQYLGEVDVVAGDPLTITINITSGGSGVDLTAFGTTWGSDLRQTTTQQTPVVFAVNSTAANTGTLVLSLTGTQTGSMATATGDQVSAWMYDLQVTGGTVTPQTPFRGDVMVFKPYTH